MSDQGSNSILQGTLIAALGGIIVLIVQAVVSALWSSAPSTPLEIISVAVPFRFVEADSLYSVKGDYVAAAIKSCAIVPAGKSKNYSDEMQASMLDAARVPLIDLVKLVGSGTEGLQVIGIKNTSDEVVENTRIMITGSVKIVPPKGADLAEEAVSIAGIDPGKEMSIIVFRRMAPASYDTSNVTAIVNGKKIDVIHFSLDGQSIFSAMADQIGWPMVVFAVLVFIGALASLTAPIGLYSALSPRFRRWMQTKQDFERMLSDVEALYPKYRPDAESPFQQMKSN